MTHAEQYRQRAERDRAMMRRWYLRDTAWILVKRTCFVVATVALCVIAWKIK